MKLLQTEWAFIIAKLDEVARDENRPAAERLQAIETLKKIGGNANWIKEGLRPLFLYRFSGLKCNDLKHYREKSKKFSNSSTMGT